MQRANKLTNGVITDSLVSAGLDPIEVEQIINTAINEDLHLGPDVTTEATVEKDAEIVADVVARQSGVIAGLPIASAIMSIVGIPEESLVTKRKDGELVAKGDIVLQISGSARNILSAERTLLNFLTHLSGVATATRTWVRAIDGTKCEIRDTRKTTPGLRSLEKYAVRCGGGVNHRMALGDAALIKDNHVLAAGGIKEAIDAVRKTSPNITMEVECDTIAEVKEALDMDVKLILLDNMNLNDIKHAVELGKEYPGTRFEASGGLRLENAKEVAETGVDYMSIGALTHSSPALDLALDIRP